MKVSIITVCKNAETAIERTMLSVVTQSCFAENIEYLIVDGASTDKTVEIIEQYAGKYPIKWISEPDSGIYNAMNKGIKLATGDYLLFLNAGDYLIHYNVIKSLTNLFQSDKFDVISGNAFYINPFTEHYHINAKKNCGAFFFYHDALPHQAVFYKKNLFDKFGLYDEKFVIKADHVFNKKVICNEHVTTKYVDQIISVFFYDGISSKNIDLSSKETEIFHNQYFTSEEMKEIQRQQLIIERQNRKSILRFLSKMLMKIHEFLVSR